MTTTEQVLVIILSVSLALFLVLAITLVIMFIALVRRAQTVVDKVDGVADTAVEISQTVRKTVGSFTFFNVIHTLTEVFAHRKKS